MKHFRSFITLACALPALAAQAHGPAVSRYRVTEISPPASATSGCLPAYSRSGVIETINDFGVVNATLNCYVSVGPGPNDFAPRGTTFVASPWFGAFELPKSEPGTSFSLRLNNLGAAFGYEIPGQGGAFYATKWSLAGGRERVFDDPACENIRFSGAVDGNARYTVGWALRPEPILLPFVLCVVNTWMIRDASGVVTEGPARGSPNAVNALNVAVGHADRAAIRYDVPTGQIRVLRAADDTHSADAYDINDLGEIVGNITEDQVPGVFNSCDPGVAVRWDRNGREYRLPHLGGAVSSRAYGAGYDGDVVGDSGDGQYCPFFDNAGERAVLWKGGRVYDLNSLIPRSSGITLTYAFSANRRGQITAGGFDNDEPLTQCPQSEFDPATGTVVVTVTPCHTTRMYVLTPVGR